MYLFAIPNLQIKMLFFPFFQKPVETARDNAIHARRAQRRGDTSSKTPSSHESNTSSSSSSIPPTTPTRASSDSVGNDDDFSLNTPTKKALEVN